MPEVEEQEEQTNEEQQTSSQSSNRRSASEIFAAALKNARDELDRSSRALAFSGLAGGLTMGLTGLSVAAVRATIGTGGWADVASFLFYPIGFIAVIIGREGSSPGQMPALQEQVDAFDADVRDVLLSVDPSGTFHQDVTFGARFARR